MHTKNVFARRNIDYMRKSAAPILFLVVKNSFLKTVYFTKQRADAFKKINGKFESIALTLWKIQIFGQILAPENASTKNGLHTFKFGKPTRNLNGLARITRNGLKLDL